MQRSQQTRSRQSRRTLREEEIYSYASLNEINGVRIERESAKATTQTKARINVNRRASYEDLIGLSLPHYYPDSKCDTDITDNISINDNTSYASLDNNNNLLKSTPNLSQKCSSTGNISNINLNWEVNEHESISYDENIFLSTKKCYSNEGHYAKPRTIRGPTPYHENYTYNKRRDSIYKAQYEKPPDKHEEEELDCLETETDTNFDEILYSDTAKVLEIHEGDNYSKGTTLCSYSNIEDNPVYESNNKGSTKVSTPTSDISEQKTISRETPDQIKTLIEVAASDETPNPEQYKTIVAVDTQNSENCEEDSKSSKSKQHSHNYLREFLETQKGSKKPLQNFISKKLSNLSRRNTKDTNRLSDNQFHSLPDISASENLKRCEKIDRKLRKCEKTTVVKNGDVSKENRFIVNIGRHFDITANSNIPVDFELKIAKVSKKSKNNKKNTLKKEKSDEQLIEAVKNLKQTLSASSMSLDDNYYRKPEIVEVTAKNNSQINLRNLDKDFEMDKKECTKEYQEKVDTMRNYWGKLVEPTNEPVEQEPVKCKIVDLQTKVEDVKKKFEPKEEKEEEKPVNKVKLVKQMFEVKPPVEKTEKLSPIIKETCSYFEKSTKVPYFDSHNQLQSLNPNIVEIINKEDKKEVTTNETNTKSESVTKERDEKPKKLIFKRSGKPVSKSNSIAYPEFDYVRYRVVKSDLFQKKIFANCDKETQFDDLMQYLQDYSFQELLIDNNIVIIEPIRSKVQYDPRKPPKISSQNVTPLLKKSDNENDSNSLRKHFFYHPIRVNKEVNDDELPNPDTVRQARQFFEGGLKRSQSNIDVEATSKEKCNKDNDPDKDHCSATDSNSNPSNISDFGSQENIFEGIDESDNCYEQQFVSEDILEKIREHGSTVTYYGGRVLKQESSQPILTKVIMEEIKNNQSKFSDCNCKNTQTDNQGVKYKLVKSNSCSSRLELVGTNNLMESRKKFIAKHKKLLNERNLKNEKNACIKEEMNENEQSIQNPTVTEKNAINESIKKKSFGSQPKIIGEEMKKDNKMTQWGDVKKETIYSTITYSDKSSQKKLYEFHNYDRIKTKTNKQEMEFEQYEVA